MSLLSSTWTSTLQLLGLNIIMTSKRLISLTSRKLWNIFSRVFYCLMLTQTYLPPTGKTSSGRPSMSLYLRRKLEINSHSPPPSPTLPHPPFPPKISQSQQSFLIAWENIRHFATPPVVYPRNDVKSSQVNLYLNTVKSIRNLKIKNNLTILNKIQNLTTTNLTKTCFSWMPCITLKVNIN